MYKNELISIIVPVYNVEKYIDKCINSILLQTYQHIEIILVDDGSIDNSGVICDNYQKKDCRIKVIHKKNGGLSDARNVGIEFSKGKYITFIDSDDYIEKNYIEFLYKILKTNEAEISICDFKYISEYERLMNKISNSKKEIIYSKKEALKELCTDKTFPNSAWGKLYLKNLFEDIRYPKGRIFEDIPTTYKLFSKCNKIVYGDWALYNYLYREKAISKSEFNLRRLDAIDFTNEMTNYIEKEFPDLNEECRRKRFVEAIYAYKNWCEGEQRNPKIENYLYNEISKNNSIHNKNLSFKFRIYSIVTFLGKNAIYYWTKIENKVSQLRLVVKNDTFEKRIKRIFRL